MPNQPLPELINQAQELLAQIRKHPDFKTLKYHPDVTLGDAEQALIELQSQTLLSSEAIRIFALEGFTA
ncbi:MAG: hypothetical protein MET45_04830 [Nostoc sp. LLA-1]|uniref:hypothetical protein n=1 Tax=Nostoc sp. CCY0012 TaxID=1056123 RepID=UPI002A019D73|nr:hypothetical protein [Cyanocohniella sp. LLY]